MALTIGLTSMDKATETALRAALQAAAPALGIQTRIAQEHDADYVIVDMDSMYGPMGWLRLHAAGKQVIGLTASPRTQADFRLGRPFDTAATEALLHALAAHAGTMPTAGAAAQADAPPPTSHPPPHPPPRPMPEAAPDTAPVASPGIAQARPADTVVDARDAVDITDAGTTGDDAERPLGDWLRPGLLQGRVRVQREGSPALWLDTDARTYAGPAQLKALDALYGTALARSDFEPVDDDAWDAGTTGTPPQPLARLAWYGGLLAGRGTLLPGHDPDARYRLLKWPQTEREFPRHFRIATAMMKDPATVDEIAAASGTPAAEVADFVNAHLVTGFAEAWQDRAPEAEPPPRQGLFSRLIRK